MAVETIVTIRIGVASSRSMCIICCHGASYTDQTFTRQALVVAGTPFTAYLLRGSIKTLGTIKSTIAFRANESIRNVKGAMAAMRVSLKVLIVFHFKPSSAVDGRIT
jgi:hypothetical protein